MSTANDIADKLASEHNLTKSAARAIVASFLTTIVDAAASGDEVSLPGFGKFKVKQTAAREGRNPSTGKAINIAASTKLTYSPAKAVKDRLNS